MANMINVYNQLVGMDNTDCTKFKEILDKHFEKYRFFVSLLEEIGEEHIETYECEKHSYNSLLIKIIPSSEVIISDLKNRMISITKRKFYSKYFKYSITSESDYINIKISSKMKESEFYRMMEEDCLYNRKR